MSDVPPSLRDKKNPRRFDFSWMGSIANRIRNALSAHTAEETEAIRRQSDVAWRESLHRLSQRPAPSQKGLESENTVDDDELPGMFSPNNNDESSQASAEVDKPEVLEEVISEEAMSEEAMSEEDLDALYAAEVDADDVDADDYDADFVDYDPEFANVDADEVYTETPKADREDSGEENLPETVESSQEELEPKFDNKAEFEPVSHQLDSDLVANESVKSGPETPIETEGGKLIINGVQSGDDCADQTNDQTNETDQTNDKIRAADLESANLENAADSMDVDEESLTNTETNTIQQPEKKPSFFRLNREKLVGFFFGPGESATNQEEEEKPLVDTNAECDFANETDSRMSVGEETESAQRAFSSPITPKPNSANQAVSEPLTKTNPESAWKSRETPNICWNLFNVGFSVSPNANSGSTAPLEPIDDKSFSSLHEPSYDFSYHQYTPTYSQDAADQEFNVLSQTAYRLMSSSALFGGAPAPRLKSQTFESMPASLPKENTEELIRKNIHSAQVLFAGSSLFGGKRKRESESSDDSLEMTSTDLGQNSPKKNRVAKKPRLRAATAIPGRQPHMTRRALRILEAEREKEAGKDSQQYPSEVTSPERKRRLRK